MKLWKVSLVQVTGPRYGPIVSVRVRSDMGKIRFLEHLAQHTAQLDFENGGCITVNPIGTQHTALPWPSRTLSALEGFKRQPKDPNLQGALF
jgi:hypothetical protein